MCESYRATVSIFYYNCVLADILKEFNPNLIGASVGSGDENSDGANLNVAVAGNIAQ